MDTCSVLVRPQYGTLTAQALRLFSCAVMGEGADAATPSGDGDSALPNGDHIARLNSDFMHMVNADSGNSEALSPLRRRAEHDAATPSWGHSAMPGDSPGTARASRRHRSQPFFIGVAGTLWPSIRAASNCMRDAVCSGSCAAYALQTGGTASGKTTVCDMVKQRLNDQCVVMLSQDSFYRGLTPEELQNVSGGHLRCWFGNDYALSRCKRWNSEYHSPCSSSAEYDFDSPDAFDAQALVHCMQDLQVLLLGYICIYAARSNLASTSMVPADESAQRV